MSVTDEMIEQFAFDDDGRYDNSNLLDDDDWFEARMIREEFFNDEERD